jgi:hypothetical protein
VAGGALLYDARFWFAGFALLVLHGVLDSSDGQLARMTGQTSDFGRVLDGAAGYLTHAAIYVALLAAAIRDGAGPAIDLLAAVAAVSNVVHAQLYDYHRTMYGAVVLDGVLPPRRAAGRGTRLHERIAHLYEATQRGLAGPHVDVERQIASRSPEAVVSPRDRLAYRSLFYPRVRGWNLLGDNTRFYMVGVLAIVGRVDWFFWLVAGPMNAMLAVLWIRQARADRRFLAGA